MVAVLLLDEGSMITLMIMLLRFGFVAISGTTILMTLNPRYLALRIVGLALACFLLLVGYGLLGDTEYADPNGRHVVGVLCVPVVIGVLSILWFAVRSFKARQK